MSTIAALGIQDKTKSATSGARSNTHGAHEAFSDTASQQEKPGSSIMQPWKRMDVVLSTICLNIFAVILPVMILQIYDRIIPNHALGTLSILAVGVSIAVVLECILRIARSYILSWIGQQFDYSTSVSVFSRLMKTDLYSLNRMGVGEHIENMESLGTLKEFLAGQSFLIFLDLPFLLFFLALIDYFGGRSITIASVVILIFFAISALYLGHKLHETLVERQNIGDRKYSFLIEMLNNYHTVKSLGIESLFLRRFERIQLQSSFIEYKINLHSSEARDLGSMFSSILFGAIIYVAGNEVIHNTISPGAMAACLFLSNRVIQPLQQGLSVWTRFQYFKIAQKRFDAVFKLPMETDRGSKITLEGSITFKNICFNYENTDHILFKNLNLHIKKGEFISIIGKSGAGKTTLSQLMLSNIYPTSGEILMDGTPLSTINIPHFRKQIAYLAPKGEIFNGTVMDNLTFFSRHTNVHHVKELSRQVGLDRWVSQLPYGYDSIIGNNLDNDLPLGVQQRLCFVRALLLAPRILILDEANTNMDVEGDTELLKVLDRIKRNMTIIFITHRPSIARMADRIFEVKDQTIIERNAYEL
ncbi:MAG: ATP-binding cassette domain-containing protein [Alphaproteobacteria bacterium]|nr:ATP-binding cassette domain-containing protein [Alphaproteobacteria bacterium]